MAYEMLTGKLPFDSPYVREVGSQICTKEVDFEGFQNISGEAKNFVRRLLEKNP